MVYNYNTKVPINNTTQHPNTAVFTRRKPKIRQNKILFETYSTKRIPLKIIVVVLFTYIPSKLCKIRWIQALGSCLQLIIPFFSPYWSLVLQIESPIARPSQSPWPLQGFLKILELLQWFPTPNKNKEHSRILCVYGLNHLKKDLGIEKGEGIEKTNGFLL